MNMNDTVARIVELMFQDLEMSDEVAAIRDEVMDNCQERYNDLVASGMDEDDAIAAVVESLKGMDEVLASYKRRKTQKEPEKAKWYYVFNDTEVQRIDLNLVNEDVTIVPSEDEYFHVKWDGEETPLVQCEVADGVMKIDRKPGEAYVHRNEKEQIHFSTENGETTFDSLESALENLGKSVDSTLKSVGETLRNLFGGKGEGLNIKFRINDGGVVIQVPESALPEVKLLTTSGDVKITDVALRAMDIVTTSGDVRIDLNEDQGLPHAAIRTTSGDVDAEIFAREANVTSISGDLEIEGRLEKLHAATTSGDIDVRADVASMTFKTISGDADLTFDSVELREVNGSTISGDVDVSLPSGVGVIAIQTRTRSGDVHTHCNTNGCGPTVSGTISTISGDIAIW